MAMLKTEKLKRKVENYPLALLRNAKRAGNAKYKIEYGVYHSTAHAQIQAFRVIVLRF